jgi:hypothetical protein
MAQEIATFPESGPMTAFISQAFYIEDYIEDATKPHPKFPALPELEALN